MEECRYNLCPGHSGAVPYPRCHACPHYFDTKFTENYATVEDCQASECGAGKGDGDFEYYYFQFGFQTSYTDISDVAGQRCSMCPDVWDTHTNLEQFGITLVWDSLVECQAALCTTSPCDTTDWETTQDPDQGVGVTYSNGAKF
jgi:hypothetical protein